MALLNWTSTPLSSLRVPQGLGAGLVYGALLIASAALACGTTVVHAGESRSLETRGKSILAANCARCHAIEASASSPLRAAPHMRDIYLKFPARELEEELREGKVSHHQKMPQIAFSDEEVEAILAYLYRLANEVGP